MHIEEFLKSEAEEFGRKYQKYGWSIKVFSTRENSFYVVQVPGCDELYNTSKKFRNWKNKFELKALDYLKVSFILVTDVYKLDSSFKQIY